MPEYKKVQELTCKGYEYIINSNGSEEWYKDGQPHRLDGPAVIRPDGSESWYKESMWVDFPFRCGEIYYG